MRKKAKQLLLTMLVFAACVFSCDDWERNYPVLGQNSDSGSYQINPNTILNLLGHDNATVFLPIDEASNSGNNLLPTGSFAWTQSDYLRIANALSQYVWGENTDSWKMYMVNFKRDCQSKSPGFDSFVAIFFKENDSGSERQYSTRQIDIFPLARQVTWGSGTNYPRPFFGNWHSINLSDFKLTADDAFQITETNGGIDARLRVGNKCNVLISSPHKNEELWSVSYYVLASFQVLVDPQNGDFEIFNQFQ